MTDGGLRPLGLGELLDAAIKIYRARWRDLIKVTAVVTLPAVVVETLIRMSTGSGGLSGTNGSVFTSSTRAGSTNIQLHQVAVQLGGTLALTVVSIFATALAVGGVLRCVAGVYLGEEVGWRESLRFALGRLGSIVLVSLLVLLCELVGLLFCIIGYAVPWTFLFASIPALLVEGLKGRAALRRSRDLVRGRGWHVFATLGVGYLIGAAITGALAGLLVAVLFASHGNVVVFDLVTGVVTLITTVLVTPFTAALTMAVYFDLRVRKEGFDLWLLAQKVGGGAPEGGFPAQPGAPQWQPVPGWGAPPPGWGPPGAGGPPPATWGPPGAPPWGAVPPPPPPPPPPGWAPAPATTPAATTAPKLPSDGGWPRSSAQAAPPSEPPAGPVADDAGPVGQAEDAPDR
jgi:hypothetical protein